MPTSSPRKRKNMKNNTKKNYAPWYRIKSKDEKEVGFAKFVIKNDGTPSDWDAKLDSNNPNDLEVLARCQALWSLGRTDEGLALIYDYASKNGKLVNRTCDFVFA